VTRFASREDFSNDAKICFVVSGVSAPECKWSTLHAGKLLN
jgi:hypothetical protein